jgi:rSAM/selenodomain-associated transferase 1
VARQFGIFAKYWEPGQVKTRLAAEIGPEHAALFHRVCLETLLRRFSRIADRRILAFTPAGRATDFACIVPPGWQLAPQTSDDLGRRIEHYFTSAFVAGASRVILIGSDSPTLPEPVIVEAFDSLNEHDVVLGPTDDGGYYLIGLSRLVPRLFDDIDWSTPAVWSQTLDRLHSIDQSHHVLPPRYDVDTPADLARLRDELAGDPRDEFSVLRRLCAALG